MIDVRARAIPHVDAGVVRTASISTHRGRRTVALSIDALAVAQGPIVRGNGPPHRLVEFEGRWVRVEAAAALRKAVLPAIGEPPSHASRFLECHPGRRIAGMTGAGNLGMNPGVLARTAEGTFGVHGPYDGALAVDEEGLAQPVSFEDEREAVLTLTGPSLVRDGRPCLPDPRCFPDPRHLLLFPYVTVAPGGPIDFGQDALLRDPDLYAKAVAGACIELPLEVALAPADSAMGPLRRTPVSPGALLDALRIKGYLQSDRPAECGRFRLGADHLEIVFLPGIYPHHVLLVNEDSTARSLIIGGLSNRAGVVLSELAEDLARQGFREALLMDNGGDVALHCLGIGFVIPPAEDDRAERWPVSACLIYHEGIP